MSGAAAVFETTILETHLDGFGHVNNAVYLELFETARWALITAGGLGREEVLRRRAGPVVLDVYLRLRRELRRDDKIRITTAVAEGRHRIFRLRQEIYNAAGERCTEADFTFGIFHLDSRRLIRPDETWRRALGVATVDNLDTPSKR